VKLALFISITFLLVKLVPHQEDGREFASLAGEAIQNRDYCEALSYTGKALNQKPWSARYLTAWANLKPLVHESCNLEFVAGDPIKALETALSTYPLDFDVLLASASLYFERGEQDEAYKLLARVLSFDRGFSKVRIERIISMIRSKEAVQAVFPTKFPQAVTWRPILKESRYPSVRESADKILFAAIKTLSDYPTEIAEAHLSAVYSQGVAGDLRVEVDRVASRIFRDSNSWNNHRYVDLRSSLKEAPSEFGLVDPESSAFRNQIIKWGSPIRLTFGAEPVAFGFFIPASSEYLELEIRGKIPRFESIKFFVSNDNENWAETGFKDKPKVASFAGRTWVIFSLPDSVRYGKIYVQDERLNPASTLLAGRIFTKVEQ